MTENASPPALAARLCARLRFPLPFAARRIGRVLVWAFWLVYFVFIALVLVLRYAVLPQIERYRPELERLASRQLGQSVHIGRIEARWKGIHPDLFLLDVRIQDAEGRPALTFSRVEAVLSWWSLPSAQLKLRLLRIDEPRLHLRRDGDGRFYIAGLPLGQETGNGGLADWILEQRQIRIHGASLLWDDELRKAPPLELTALNFALDNVGRRHRFGLTAQSPSAWAARVDVRGDFWGRGVERVENWSGQLYAAVDYADLAIWQNWVDYSVALPHGRGAFRAWVDFAQGRWRETTADLVLNEVSLRFASTLPALALKHMTGRLRVRGAFPTYELDGRQVELVTEGNAEAHAEEAKHRQEAIRIAPTDFHLAWQTAAAGAPFAGWATAKRLDLTALAGLAAYVPLTAQSRRLLDEYAPRGRLEGVEASWRGDAERLTDYSLKATLDGLSIKAGGSFPGFRGLSGSLKADEKGGELNLHAKKSSIDLPSVFPVSLIELDSLNARATWKIAPDAVDVELVRVEFAGPEAAGSARGTYRNTGEGPGSIDLTAALTRAEARAVWRYMPHVVGEAARHWLRRALLAGQADEARLILKGDLRHFPFAEKAPGQEPGEFLVTVKARDIVLDYGPGWPRIDKVSGDLRFAGRGMRVEARGGAILGAQLADTQAVIADFDAPTPVLLVQGRVAGATSEFLRFIDQSPVAEWIDRFTEDMRTSGNGRLDLKLALPLDEKKLAQAKVEGVFRLLNNEVTVDPSLPPLKAASGNVKFTENEMQLAEIKATLFGSPLRIDGGSRKDGHVAITARGSVNFDALRKQAAWPLLNALSGEAAYRGEIRVDKQRKANLVVESDLVGVSSSLPEPFGKITGTTLPFWFEKRFLANEGNDPADGPARNQISVRLGEALSAQLICRSQKDGMVVDRGRLAVGRPLPPLANGLALAVAVRQIDVDRWRWALSGGANDAGDMGDSGQGQPAWAALSSWPARISVSTDELLLAGRRLNKVELTALASAALWKIHLDSRQASGELQWETAGKGKLTARLRQLKIDPPPREAAARTEDATRPLPALDIVADDFSLGERRLGRLGIQAQNEGGVWRLNSITVNNPHGTFSGRGQWRSTGGDRTQLSFRIDSQDTGKLLARLGYPDALRAGTAGLEGRLAWNGSPIDLDFGSLDGTMGLKAGNGQFLKLHPGAAGKLLGLISLQGLPRRISLDFKDIFSEGLAFDSIAGELAVAKGVLRTEQFQIDGPSARILMRGEVDLKDETQRLDVTVQPELGGTAALGVALVNPVAGVATWVAHKALQNPLNRLFSFDYRVTGSWEDPKVEKLTKPAAGGEKTPEKENHEVKN